MRVTQQCRHERVGVDHLARVGIENQDSVLGHLEQPSVPDFGVLHGGFRPPAIGDVLDGQKDQVRVLALGWKPAGVQEHVSSPEAREGVINLEVFNGMAVGEDFGQQRPQPRDIPLTVA